MAENKKSFILYADLIHTVKKMPKGKQAELFMTILKYVNDENPVVKDLIVSLVWEPVKLQLKRDLRYWEEQRVKRSEAGKLGGLRSGEVRKFEAETKQNEAKGSNASKNEANEAVNVNVNVNDTVNDIIYKDKSLNKKFIKPTTAELTDYAIEQNLDDFSAAGTAESFFDHYESNGWKIGGKSAMKDWQAALRTWIRNSKKYTNGNTTTAKIAKLGTSEARTEDLRKWGA